VSATHLYSRNRPEANSTQRSVDNEFASLEARLSSLNSLGVRFAICNQKTRGEAVGEEPRRKEKNGLVWYLPFFIFYALPASLLASVYVTLCDTVVFDAGWLSGGVILRGRR